MAILQKHEQRKHSKYSASGASRWFSCSGSIALSEGIPSKESVYSLEGTKAHEVLETILKTSVGLNSAQVVKVSFDKTVPKEMIQYASHAARFILHLHESLQDSELLIETRVLLNFIHPEAFGSLDSAVLDYFGTLHILDFKYGKALVSPKENLQFIFYALAVAHLHHWNFKRVRMWTLQPRVKGFDGYVFWDISIEELKAYIPKFKAAIARVQNEPYRYNEGEHCHFCPAKTVCPLKMKKKQDEARMIFGSPIKKEVANGKEKSSKEESLKSEADWKKEKGRKKESGKKSSGVSDDSADDFY